MTDFTITPTGGSLRQGIVDYDQYEPQVEGLGLYKRAVERWHADFTFRAAYEKDREAALASAGLGAIAPDDLDILVYKSLATQASEGEIPLPEICAEYRRFIKVKQRHAKQVRDSRPAHDRYRRWRQRMINSGVFSQGVAKFEQVVHAPFAVELCRGCTVNCWFCGVDAAKYEGHIPFDEATESLWRGMLRVLKEEMGQEFAQHGFCYWATEPLDNPDYEKFIGAFHEELGYLPQTTTAVAMRDPARTRGILELAERSNAFVQRFSVTTKKDFDAIHAEFDPEELLLVELIPQFENRASPKATAGRVRDLVLKRLDEGKSVPFRYNLVTTSSIACVSGFLINLPDRTVKLITPCRATDDWPLGYRVLAESTFDTLDAFRTFVVDCLEHRMVQELGFEDPVVIRHPDMATLEATDASTLAVVGGGLRISLNRIDGAEDLKARLDRGYDSLERLLEDRVEAGFDLTETLTAINRIFRTGVLRDPDDRPSTTTAPVQVSVSAADS